MGIPFKWPQPLGADGSGSASAQPLWFGGDYNPEQWDEQTWDEDIRLMRKARVNIVSVGIFSWARIQKGPELWDFSWLDDIIDRLGRAGIAVDLGSATASPPPWLTTLHPEILPVDMNGSSVWPGARQAWRPTSPVFKRYALAMCEKMAEHYRSNPYVVAWHVGNEYGCHNRFDYSDDAARAFRAWCEARYETVDALNTAWGTDFWSQRMTDFSQVIPPRNVGGQGNYPNPTRTLDFRRFSSDALKDFYIAERDVFLAATPDKPVTTNFMISGSPMILDYPSWASEVSFVSNDHYFLPGSAHLDELLFSASLVDGIAAKKPWWLMENSTSAVNWRETNFRKQPGELVRDALAYTAMGADALCFFQWRQSRAGAEKFHSAMLPTVGEDSQVFRDVCELGADLEELSVRGVSSSQLSRSSVAVVYDVDSAWAVEHPAMPSQARGQQSEAFEWFRAFLDMGVTTDVVPTAGCWERYQAVVFPAVYLMSQRTIERVEAYVRSGGKAFVTYSTCIADQEDHIWLGGYGNPLQDVTGVHVEELNPLEMNGRLAEFNGLDSSLDITNGAKATYWTDVITRIGPSCEVLERYRAGEFSGMDGIPAITLNTYGQGAAVYVGAKLSSSDLALSLRSVCERFGILEQQGQSEQSRRASIARVTRVRYHAPTDVCAKFVFTFNRSHEAAAIELDGSEVILAYHAHVSAGGQATLEPSGVVVQRMEMGSLGTDQGEEVAA